MAQMKDYKAKVSPRNKIFADKIRKLSEKFSIVGVVDVAGLPAPQFQRIRGSLKKTAEVLIVKRNLIDLVLNELEKKHPGISKLVDKASGVVGLVFTNDNPFTLYKTAKKNKSSAPAKAGQIAPNEIVVPAGPTSFSPGPIIGELGAFKIKAGIEGGKVEIKEDSVVASEGDEISSDLAGILTRLGIEPMEVGLNIKAIYENGTVFGKDTLDVDEDAILADLKAAASESAALAYGIGYYTKDNISMFISEASRDALGLGLGIEYPAAETIATLLGKAQAQGAGVAGSVSGKVEIDGAPSAQPSAGAQAPVAEDSSSANEEKKEEKEAAPEADAAAGLGGLF